MPDPIKCVLCSHEFSISEIFIAYTNEEDNVVVSMCLEAHPEFLTDDKEKEGTGWWVFRRNLDGYEIAE